LIFHLLPVVITTFISIIISSTSLTNRFAVRSSALQAEWSPKDGSKWEEKDYETELKKLEQEAEQRLDAKIAEMMSKIEATGAK
jgi:uncharacterized protein YlxW (UPF0749 family)